MKNNNKVGKRISWRGILVIMFICLTIIIISTLYGVSYILGKSVDGITDSVDSASKVVSEVLNDNPELGILLLDKDEQYAELLAGLSILKQMEVHTGFEIEGTARGRFTTREDRKLEKVNLECIDKYSYRTSINKNSYKPNTQKYIESTEWFEQLNDKGCTIYHRAKNVSYFKCPERNCELREITREVSDEFIPLSIEIEKVSSEIGQKT